MRACAYMCAVRVCVRACVCMSVIVCVCVLVRPWVPTFVCARDTIHKICFLGHSPTLSLFLLLFLSFSLHPPPRHLSISLALRHPRVIPYLSRDTRPIFSFRRLLVFIASENNDFRGNTGLPVSKHLSLRFPWDPTTDT